MGSWGAPPHTPSVQQWFYGAQPRFGRRAPRARHRGGTAGPRLLLEPEPPLPHSAAGTELLAAPRSSPFPGRPAAGAAEGHFPLLASLLGTAAPRPARLPVRIPPRPRTRPGLPARKETRTARKAPPPRRAASEPDWLPRYDWQRPAPSAGRHVACGAGSGRCGAVSPAVPGRPRPALRAGRARPCHTKHRTAAPLPRPRCQVTSSPDPSPHAASPTCCGLWSRIRGRGSAPAGISQRGKPCAHGIRCLRATHGSLVPVCGLCLSGVLTDAVVTLWDRLSALERYILFFFSHWLLRKSKPDRSRGLAQGQVCPNPRERGQVAV